MTGFTLKGLRDKYALANSQFGTFAGVPVHYLIEGQGPPLVLVHGPGLDLTVWDSWVKELSRDFQILRFDRLRHGLTGQANDRPIDVADEGALLEAFVDALELRRFALAGMSCGGIIAARHAAIHVARVSHLILVNIPAYHAGEDTPGGPVGDPPSQAAQRTAVQDMIRQNLVDPSAAKKPTLKRLGDFACRNAAARVADGQGRALSIAERRAMLARIGAPTLVIRSQHDRALLIESPDVIVEMRGAAHTSLFVVENAGPLHPLEKGVESARQVRTFLREN